MQDAIKGWKPSLFQDVKKTWARPVLIHEIPCEAGSDNAPCSICELAKKEFGFDYDMRRKFNGR